MIPIIIAAARGLAGGLAKKTVKTLAKKSAKKKIKNTQDVKGSDLRPEKREEESSEIEQEQLKIIEQEQADKEKANDKLITKAEIAQEKSESRIAKTEEEINQIEDSLENKENPDYKTDPELIKIEKEKLEILRDQLAIQKEQLEEQKEAEYEREHERKTSLKEKAKSMAIKVKDGAKTGMGKVVDGAKKNKGLLGKLMGGAALIAAFWPIIKEKIGSFVEWIADNVPDLIKGVWESVKNMATGIMDMVVKYGPGLIKNVINGLAEVASSLLDGIVKYGPKVLTMLIDGVKTLAEKVLSGIVKYGPKVATMLWDGFKGLLKAVVPLLIEYVPKIVDLIWKGLTVMFNDTVEAIKEYGPDIFEMVKKGITGAVDWVVNVIKEYGPQVWEMVKVGITSAVDWVVNTVKDYGPQVWESFKAGLGIAVDWVVTKASEFGSDIWVGIKSKFTDLKGWVFGAISDMWDSIRDGIRDGIQDFISDKIGGIFSTEKSDNKEKQQVKSKIDETKFSRSSTKFRDQLSDLGILDKERFTKDEIESEAKLKLLPNDQLVRLAGMSWLDEKGKKLVKSLITTNNKEAAKEQEEAETLRVQNLTPKQKKKESDDKVMASINAQRKAFTNIKDNLTADKEGASEEKIKNLNKSIAHFDNLLVKLDDREKALDKEPLNTMVANQTAYSMADGKGGQVAITKEEYSKLGQYDKLLEKATADNNDKLFDQIDAERNIVRQEILDSKNNELVIAPEGKASNKTIDKKLGMKPFAVGGYTGTGKDDEIAGVVHKNEYVLTPEDIKELDAAAKEGDNDNAIKRISDGKAENIEAQLKELMERRKADAEDSGKSYEINGTKIEKTTKAQARDIEKVNKEQAEAMASGDFDKMEEMDAKLDNLLNSINDGTYENSDNTVVVENKEMSKEKIEKVSLTKPEEKTAEIVKKSESINIKDEKKYSEVITNTNPKAISKDAVTDPEDELTGKKVSLSLNGETASVSNLTKAQDNYLNSIEAKQKELEKKQKELEDIDVFDDSGEQAKIDEEIEKLQKGYFNSLKEMAEKKWEAPEKFKEGPKSLETTEAEMAYSSTDSSNDLAKTSKTNGKEPGNNKPIILKEKSSKEPELKPKKVSIPSGGGSSVENKEAALDLTKIKDEDVFTLSGSAKKGGFAKMNKDQKHNVKAMGYEYAKETGEKMSLGSAYRSVNHQKALFDAKFEKLKKKYPEKSNSQIYALTRKTVAPPGRSAHNTGLAVDIDMRGENNPSLQVDKAISMGLFEKYNLKRPLKNEAWHIVPSNLSSEEQNNMADKLAKSSENGTFNDEDIKNGTFRDNKTIKGELDEGEMEYKAEGDMTESSTNIKETLAEDKVNDIEEDLKVKPETVKTSDAPKFDTDTAVGRKRKERYNIRFDIVPERFEQYQTQFNHLSSMENPTNEQKDRVKELKEKLDYFPGLIARVQANETTSKDDIFAANLAKDRDGDGNVSAAEETRVVARDLMEDATQLLQQGFNALDGVDDVVGGGIEGLFDGVGMGADLKGGSELMTDQDIGTRISNRTTEAVSSGANLLGGLGGGITNSLGLTNATTDEAGNKVKEVAGKGIDKTGELLSSGKNKLMNFFGKSKDEQDSNNEEITSTLDESSQNIDGTKGLAELVKGPAANETEGTKKVEEKGPKTLETSPGDTLSIIAKDRNISLVSLMNWNEDIEDPDKPLMGKSVNLEDPNKVKAEVGEKNTTSVLSENSEEDEEDEESELVTKGVIVPSGKDKSLASSKEGELKELVTGEEKEDAKKVEEKELTTGEKVQATVGDTMKSAQKTLSEATGGEGTIDGIADVVGGGIEGLFDGVGMGADLEGNAEKQSNKAFGDRLGGLGNNLLSSGAGLLGGLGGGITNSLGLSNLTGDQATDKVKGMANKGIDYIKEAIPDSAKAMASSGMSSIKGLASGAGDKAKGMFGSAKDKLGSLFGSKKEEESSEEIAPGIAAEIPKEAANQTELRTLDKTANQLGVQAKASANIADQVQVKNKREAGPKEIGRAGEKLAQKTANKEVAKETAKAPIVNNITQAAPAGPAPELTLNNTAVSNGNMDMIGVFF